MTRIIGGNVGGRRIQAPPGGSTRPTSDRVREALFSALESQLGTLAGRRFLDLYAGSGAVGLEARSRGAATVTLVEQDRAVAGLIRGNCRSLGLSNVTVVQQAVERWAGRPSGDVAFDAVFADPPYLLAADVVAAVLVTLAEHGHLAPAALMVLERSRRDPAWTWPQGFRELRARRYGETMLWYGLAP